MQEILGNSTTTVQVLVEMNREEEDGIETGWGLIKQSLIFLRVSCSPPYSEDSQYPRIFSKSCLQFRDSLEDEMGRNILHCSSFWVSFQKPRAVHINYALDFILFVFVIFAGEKMLIFHCFLCLFVLLEIMLFCCDFLLYY